MIDASPLLTALMEHVQAGGSQYAKNAVLGTGQSLKTRMVVAQLTRAFHPLSCTAETYDFVRQLRYRVFGPAGTVLVNVHGIPLSSLFGREALDAEIEKTRAELERQGFPIAARQT